MYNEILKIGPFIVRGYGLMIAIGVIAALMIGDYRAKKKGLGEDFAFSLTTVCVIFGILGAKLLFVLLNFKDLFTDPLSVLSIGGFVVYGGIIGGIFAAYIYGRIKKYDFGVMLDLALPSVAVAQGFGRIGCFLAGCCYGAHTDAWYGVTFHHSQYAPNDIKLIPTQLISSAGMFLIAGILLLYARKTDRPGRVGNLYLILYSIGRFGVEFLRGDIARGSVGVLSTSQFISVFVVIIGLVFWFLPERFFQKKSRTEKEPEKEG